tara:strand:- start:4417 stop:5094 length:678 start_codon:yes stop_codon:yes gene_type:complete
MKKNIFTILLAITSTFYSQSNKQRGLGEFTKVVIYDGINLELIKSDKNSVNITGKNSDYVVVKNKNGDLKIRLNLEKRFSGDRTKVTLYYTSLYNIISHEGSNIFSKDTIRQADISVKAHTGSSQSLTVSLNTLNTTAATGSNINISGFVEYHDTSSASGAKINAKELLATETYANATTGGIVNVSVKKELEANSKLGGIINVYQRTQKIVEAKTLGGTINYLYK